MSPREQLGHAMSIVGFTAETLHLIAEATFADYERGQQFDDTRVAHILSAMEVLVQAGRTVDTIPTIVEHYRSTFPQDWRTRFWDSATRVACLRFNHPELYGLSPLENDPARLQAWTGTAAVHPDHVPAAEHQVPVAA